MAEPDGGQGVDESCCEGVVAVGPLHERPQYSP